MRDFGLLLLVVCVAACAYQGPGLTLVDQRLSWFSYLAADDIREQCVEGTGDPDRYRLVYNAGFAPQQDGFSNIAVAEQARGYDVIPARDGSALLRQVVDRGVTLVQGTILPGNPVAPVRALTELTAEETAELARLIEESGALAGGPAGLRLNSQQYYWLVAGCRNGQFFLTGYEYPSARYDGLRFVDFLRRHDQTGVVFPDPPAADRIVARPRCPSQRLGESRVNCFNIFIGEEGLEGNATLL